MHWVAVLVSVELIRELFVSLGAPRLFAVAFLLPIPPDLVLVLANPALALIYAAIATAGAVTAGLTGFFIGRKGGRPALESRFAGGRIERTETYFEHYGLVTIGVGAFAPIPEGYELLSVAAGVLGVDLRSYLSNQDLWISVWGGSEYPGRGVPGRTDRLERGEHDQERQR